MKNGIRWMLILFAGMFFSTSLLSANQKLKDFRGTNQKIALLGFFSEFVPEEVVNRSVEDFRRSINKYSRSYGASSIAGFTLGQNQNNQYFRPSSEKLGDSQKTYLKEAAKENNIDILVLGSLRDAGDILEVDLQLFDSRIDVLSSVVSGKVSRRSNQKDIDRAVYQLMNHLDRDGFVHPSAQDFLEMPILLREQQKIDVFAGGDGEDLSVNPQTLGGTLAGRVSIGGEKQPFWETWWFWTILGAGFATAGGLSYYFLIVDQPPTRANMTFNITN